jgi:hypothetical protein
MRALWSVSFLWWLRCVLKVLIRALFRDFPVKMAFGFSEVDIGYSLIVGGRKEG